MGVKERLDLIIKELGISGRKLERLCGFPEGSYSSVGDGVGADKLKKIFIKFPQISADWVITGSGEMFKKELNNESDFLQIIKSQLKIIEEQQKTIEFLNKKTGEDIAGAV